MLSKKKQQITNNRNLLKDVLIKKCEYNKLYDYGFMVRNC